ncbi:MAG: hypothetical protein Phog2KO_18200 [Phototrophicaceae bacterium]
MSSQVDIDTLWVLLCAILVFSMQAGFLMLEAGFTRSKNNINVAIKNISDFSITTIIFWFIGYGLMFGTSFQAFFGTTGFFVPINTDNLDIVVFFIFQVMFCGTAVTIVSGAIAERVNFAAYIYLSMIVAGVIYPVFGHWGWNGIDIGVASGWLNRAGFVDFAGSTMVHSVGGWVALAVLINIGARDGRFDEHGDARSIPASNLMIATTGVILLWFGWFGFNGGSALALNEQAIHSIVNTIIAGSAGLVGAVILSYIAYRRADVSLLLNGVLAGLVGITANAHAVSLGSSVIIGIIAVIFMFVTERVLEYFRIDDAVGAVPVHLGAGIWGTLAVALFGDLELLGTGLGRFSQLMIQINGIVVCAAWTFATSYIATSVLSRLMKLRVSAQDEYIGLNISEHNARSDLQDLFTAMDQQAQTGDLSLRVPVEPFTDVGRIAERHNRVIQSLEQAYAYTDAIVKTSLDALIIFSSQNLAIRSINPTAQTVFGYSSQDIKGQPFAILVDDPHQDLIALVYDLVHTEKHTEINARRSDGKVFPAELSITRFQQEAGIYYTATFRDISERKDAEVQRQKIYNLQLQTETALENSRLKSEFVSTVSHELRTPLNALVGYTGLLLMGAKGNIDQEAKEVVRSLEESSKHLLTLVNDILDVEKIEAGHVNLHNKPLSLHDMIKSWTEHVQVLADNKGLQLHAEIKNNFPTTIIGDRERITQIALNLLSNAIKFTKEGVVAMSIYSNDEHSQWVFEVTDTGIGIDESDQAHIFDKFRQVEGTYNRQYEGTGLGLSIVRQLAQNMGGDVYLKSKLNEGSTFSVILPLRTTQ